MSVVLNGLDAIQQHELQPRAAEPQQPSTSRGAAAAQALPIPSAATALAQPPVQPQQPPPQPDNEQLSDQYEPHRYRQRQQQQSSCGWLVRTVKWVPVLFISAVIGWSYYAYVIQLCLYAMRTLTEQVIFLTGFHIVFVMLVWSYWQTVFTDVAAVPPQFRVPRNVLDRLARAENAEQHRRILETFARELPISNRTYNGGVRFCEKCLLVKPDRAHHCSVCGQCVLKMDHHCPWVNNCVNFTNYKYFVLFLGYALFYCAYVALTSLHYFVLFWEGTLTGGVGRFNIMFLFFVSLMFALSLMSLFGYHLYLVTLNRTTLEAFRAPVFRVGGPDKFGFHLGYGTNLQEVFGDDRSRWLLPVFTSKTDGLAYPLGRKQSRLDGNYEAMANSVLDLQEAQQQQQQQQQPPARRDSSSSCTSSSGSGGVIQPLPPVPAMPKQQ